MALVAQAHRIGMPDTGVQTGRVERTGPDADGPDPEIDPDVVEATLQLARVLTGVSLRAAAIADITLPQLRVLTMVASRDRMNVAAVATGLGVHPSNATRVVDRLVRAGLLARGDDPSDRRHLVLALTGPGRELVGDIDIRRREEIGRILGQIPSLDGVGPALRAVAAAGGGIPAEAASTLGWTGPGKEPTATR